MPGEGASMSRDREGVGPGCRARLLYCETFSQAPAHYGSAPGRVNLIGEHTDYNDGFVLPMGLGLRTSVAAGPSGDGRWHFVSEHELVPAVFEGTAVGDRARRDWTGYIRGVIAGFVAAGHEVGPMCVVVASDVPIGAGLSSSAALEVATASALEALLGVALEPMDKALLCQKAEREFAGVPCGLMDQAACVFADTPVVRLGEPGVGHDLSSDAGPKTPSDLEDSATSPIGNGGGEGIILPHTCEPDGAILLDCRMLEVRRVALDAASVLVIDSGVRHAHSGGAYAARRYECQQAVAALRAAGFAVDALRDATPVMLEALRADDLLYLRARHVVAENERTLEAAALLASDEPDRLVKVGRLMIASHESLRDDFQVSGPELDRLVGLACRQPGVFGARMTGGGFGGCVVALVEPGQAQSIGQAIIEAAARECGQTVSMVCGLIEPSGDGSGFEAQED